VQVNANKIFLKGLINISFSMARYGLKQSADVSVFKNFMDTVKGQLPGKDGGVPRSDIADLASGINC
jgi:hypothetical protein